MTKEDAIDKALSEYSFWANVTFKDKILRNLAQMLGDKEILLSAMEGFFESNSTNAGGDSGILVLTDTRFIFAPSRDGKKQSFARKSVMNHSTGRGFLGSTLSLETQDGTIAFKPVSGEQSLTHFLDAFNGLTDAPKNPLLENTDYNDGFTGQNFLGSGAAISKAADYIRNATQNTLDNLSGALKNLIEENTDDSRSISEEINREDSIRIPGREGNGREENSRQERPREESPSYKPPMDPFEEEFHRLNLNFTEAKRLSSLILKIYKETNDKRLIEAIINDILIITQKADIDKSPCPPRALTLTLIVKSFIGNNDKTQGKLTVCELAEAEMSFKDLFSLDSFPMHLRTDLETYYTSFVENLLNQVNLDSGFSGYAYIKHCDAKNGTEYSEPLKAAYSAYALCAVRGSGNKGKLAAETLKSINEAISEEKAKELEGGDKDSSKEQSLDELMEELNGLIGMQNIKDQIKTFTNLIRVQKEREARKLPVQPISLHSVFYGPPGTGKTTIARILGKVYKALGLLKKGQLIETDRAGMVAGYVGQTAIKVDEIVGKALDGVLFIDEAYSLTPEDGSKDFGQEAIDALLKRMEDNRDRLAVIVAGYPDEMKRFIEANPGMKSRFNRYYSFDNYEPEELIQIFDMFIKKSSFTLSDAAREKAFTLLKEMYAKRDKTFGNGRLVRNITEKIVEIQANRLALVAELTDENLCTITEEDIPSLEAFTS